MLLTLFRWFIPGGLWDRARSLGHSKSIWKLFTMHLVIESFFLEVFLIFEWNFYCLSSSYIFVFWWVLIFKHDLTLARWKRSTNWYTSSEETNSFYLMEEKYWWKWCCVNNFDRNFDGNIFLSMLVVAHLNMFGVLRTCWIKHFVKH